MTIDTELTLDMMQVQLRWLEREMLALRRLMAQEKEGYSDTSFEALEGAWEGVDFSDSDFEASRLTMPEEL